MRYLYFTFLLWLLVSWSDVAADNGMQEFIDECNKMIETMEHCGQGWMDLEQEMIDSVDSFADRILYTEELIEAEADQILVMASRIVETEELMIDVIEACDCRNDTIFRRKQSALNPLHHNSYRIPSNIPQKVVTSPAPVVANPYSVGRCQPMDELIEVMDACLDTFEVYNDDFLSVLSYMDQAIQDMGDRIVDTECMIMNMSYQIGDMADRIVIVEEMMFNATEVCCGGSSARTKTLKNTFPAPRLSESSTISDDLIPHCQNITSPRAKKSLLSIEKAKATFHDKFLVNPFRQLQQQLRLNGRGRVPLRSNQTVSAPHNVALRGGKSDNPMPCDTWWDPFCCAAEVCADIMADMIEQMSVGADAMEEICEDIIDEIGNLADDIVATEEDILVMGLKIGDMADCIVVFIDEGIDFMIQYCPSSDRRLSPYGTSIGAASLPQLSQTVCTLDASLSVWSRRYRLSQERIQAKYNRLLALSRSVFSPASLDLLKQQLQIGSSVKDNPFGEFAEMVDACMQVMEDMMKLITSQCDSLDRLFQSLVTMSANTVQMMSSVTEMSHNVDDLETEVSEENRMMNQLVHCHD